jgi:hypothetical protein
LLSYHTGVAIGSNAPGAVPCRRPVAHSSYLALLAFDIRLLTGGHARRSEAEGRSERSIRALQRAMRFTFVRWLEHATEVELAHI